MSASIPYSAKNLVELSGGDMDFVVELLEAFIAQAKSEQIALNQEVKSKNWNEVKFIAHRLRSASGSVGAHEIARSCAELETYISNSGDIEKSVYLYVEKYQDAITIQLIEIEDELQVMKRHRN